MEAEYNPALKPVLSVIDGESLVTEEMMKIIFWLKENTFCTFFDGYKTVVPTGFSYNFSRHYALANTYIEFDELNDEEKEIISFMQNNSNQREIDNFLDYKDNPKKKKLVEGLIDKGYIEEEEKLKRKVGDENVKTV